MAQRYIPGLTARPTGDFVPEINAPKDIPPELIKAFEDGTKQPISALMEYSSMRRLTTSFKEVHVKNYSLVSKFANECCVNDTIYPQGVGKTKKEAKTQAAKIAFNIILGFETFESYGEATPTNNSVQTLFKQEPTSNSRSGNMGGEYQAPPVKRDPKKVFQNYLDRTKKMGSVTVNDGPYGFIGQVKLGGRVICEENSKTKAEAMRLAVEKALDMLQIEETLCKKDCWEDVIAKECYKKLEQLIAQCKNHELVQARHSFAAFVVNRGVNAMKPEVVAFGTGNSCLSGEHITTDGRCIIDSYAVAVARRALLKYFHKEIKSYFDGAKVMSIFEEVLGTGKLQLKDFVTIHLFLNHPPPGDYRDCLDIACPGLSEDQEEQLVDGAHFPAFSDTLPGWFSVKNEDGLIECVEEDQPPVQEFSELESSEEDLLVMSCSDKLLLWNSLGIQGSLYSAFLYPTYINSVILGRQFHHGHCSRAMCCRLYDVVNEYLPTGYRLHHPHLSTVTLHIEEMDGKPTALSINWSEGDDLPEIVDGFRGKVTENSPFRSTKVDRFCASRLSKAAFLFRFRDIGRVLKNNEILNAPNYRAAKQVARDYQTAKTVFRNFAHKIGLGHWIRKPLEIEMFKK